MSTQSIKISKDNLAKIGLWLSFTLMHFSGFEIIFVTLAIITIIFFLLKPSLNKALLTTVLPLFVIWTIAFMSGFSLTKLNIDWLKDLMHMLKPILAILGGYFMVKNLNSPNYIIKFLIHFALFSAVMHLSKIVINLNGISTHSIRTAGGLDSLVELFGFCLIFISNKVKAWKKFIPKYKYWFIFFIGISIILYFSRTMIIGFIIIMGTFYGYTQLTKQRSTILAIGVIGIVSFIFALQHMDIKREVNGEMTFLYKLKMIPEEVFNPQVNTKDHRKLWDRWRAYEANQAISQVIEKGPFAILFGKGFGSTVDLGFHVNLGGTEMRYIPITHNGYAYIFLKSGLIGLIFYLFWMIYLYRFQYIKSFSQEKKYTNLLISSFGLIYIFTSLIITGVYNVNEFYPVVLGGILALNDNIR